MARNIRIAGIEIDLVLKREHWLLVEAKSLSHSDGIHFRLNFKQRLRLERARHIFEDQKAQSVELRVAYALPSGEIIDLSLEDHDEG